MDGTSRRYSTAAGTHNFEDIKTTDLNTGGICVDSPCNIQLELDFEHEFEKIEIGGWNGNSSWAVYWGANAKIYTSRDKTNWTEVGTVPSDFGNKISIVSVKKTTARYIKFQHTSWLGLGHLKIILDHEPHRDQINKIIAYLQ